VELPPNVVDSTVSVVSGYVTPFRFTEPVTVDSREVPVKRKCVEPAGVWFRTFCFS
jgi:hypothetical protein